MMKEVRGIQSIEISGRILHALVEACEPMMLKDIAQAAKVTPAQCHAYLTSLRNVGLVHQDESSGHYQTGSFAVSLGTSYLKSNPIASSAIHELKLISEEIGVMTLIAIWGEFGPTVIHINAGHSQTELNLRQGSLFSVTGSATGRVFAAFGEESGKEELIATELERSASIRSLGGVLTRRDFDAQISAIRKCGYSTAAGMPIPEINAVSAPVFGADGRLFIVISMIGPETELPVGEGAKSVSRIVKLANLLSGSGAISDQKSIGDHKAQALETVEVTSGIR